ncbi:MAG: TraR/DksA family transcriptional regulator [Chitinophagaceae bacterium]|nr:TraR/DksA family transcriptional regulator [Chitinophagaceae bacterium]
MATKKAPKKATKAAVKRSKPVKKASSAQKTAKKPAGKKVVPAKKAAKPMAKKSIPAKKAPAKKVAKPVGKSVGAKKVAPAKAKAPAKKIAPAKKVTAKPVKAAKPAPKPVKPVKEAKKVAPVKPPKPPKAAKPAPPPKPARVPKAKPAPLPFPDPRRAPELKPRGFIRPTKKDEPVKDVKIPRTTVKTSVPYQPGYTPLDQRRDLYRSNEPIVRYSDTELNEFRELINKKLEAAKKELAYLQGLITRKDEMGGDETDNRYMTMEDGSMSMEREQLSQMASRQIQYIDHLEKALIRIENKTYGICRVTGKLIDKARLRAVPHATLSLEAKLGLVKPGNE